MRKDTGEIISLEEAEVLNKNSPGLAIPINPTPKQARLRKVGRNEPCPCGSGLKFKRCCQIQKFGGNQLKV